jgi:fibrillarin-like rRNA methylase
MTFLNRDDILNAQDLNQETVDIPEWGGEVIVRELTGEERDSYEASLINFKKDGNDYTRNLNNARAKLVARTVINEDGTRLFTDADVAALGKKSSRAISKVFDVATRISGITDQDIKELTKNSESGQSGDSILD